MKIYVSGSHSSGKTSLAKYISKQYNLPMITETARNILSENELNINSLRADIEVADQYQQQVFDRQLIEEQKYSKFVSDRSLIDILSYAGSHSRILSNLITSLPLQTYLTNLRTFDTIIFFISPGKSTLKQDGVRETISWDGVISISAQIKLLYEMFNIRYFQIDTENMSERIKLITNILSLIK